jgi:GNAT superfamily N-acetyltransferase
MNSSFCIREASKSDLPDVLRLYAQPDLDDGKVLSTSEAERVFNRMRRYPNYRVYVAVSAAHVVGTFALLIMDNLGHLGAPSAIIEDVAVDPSLQSKGIGKEMMRYAIQLATEYGCYKAVLSSNLKRERAHAFYKSLDFEQHGYSFRIDAQQTAGTCGAKRHAAAQPAVRRHHER